MNTTFQIGNVSKDDVADTLFIEIGQTFCSVSFINGEMKLAKFIEVYAFDALSLEDSIHELLQIVASKEVKVQNVVISPAFPEAILIPNKFYHHKSALLNGIYNLKHFFPLHDPIAEWQLI
ncbi:MAG TPA: hypothetical protein VEV62_05350, partial [Parafilimonas sp.]|nr:hypothetical protein [Parafilimonas sp.]